MFGACKRPVLGVSTVEAFTVDSHAAAMVEVLPHKSWPVPQPQMLLPVILRMSKMMTVIMKMLMMMMVTIAQYPFDTHYGREHSFQVHII